MQDPIVGGRGAPHTGDVLSSTKHRWLALALVLTACAGGSEKDGHHAGGDAGGEHEVRDPATEPCDPGNWRQLFPDLRECDLAGEVLDGESLRRADLSDADLTGASLEGADLFTAVLAAAVVTDAELDGAKLTSVDFAGADLSGATLIGAVLINADLSGATLAGAATDETTTCPDGDPGPCW